MAKAEYSPESILNVAEAAEFMGVSQAQVRGACHLNEGSPGRMPHFRMGKHIRIPFWGLIGWIAAQSGAAMPVLASKSYQNGRMLRTNRKPRRLTRKRS